MVHTTWDIFFARKDYEIMKDTNEKVQTIYFQMFKEKTLSEKAMIGFSMYETSRKIILSTIKDKHNWQTEFFLKFYGNDFDEKTKTKILNAINNK